MSKLSDIQTAVGMSGDREVKLEIVDGRQHSSMGTSLRNGRHTNIYPVGPLSHGSRSPEVEVISAEQPQ